jgi:hypothetical protein
LTKDRIKASAINILAVTNTKYQHDDAIILNFAYDPVVAHAVPPKLTQKRALHCFPEAARAVQFRYPLMQKFQDAIGMLRVELAQFAVG